MTQPTPYTRQFSFTNFFAASPTGVFPGNSLDLELNTVKTTADQILQNLKLLQNDDGTIKNGSIGAAQLSSSLQTGFLPPTVWSPSIAYSASPASTVFTSNKFYSCLVSHTSGSSFATDLAAGRWTLIADLTGIPLQSANNIAITPAGGIVTTDVQSAMYGIDTRITANTASIAGFVAANVTDSTSTGRALMTAASTDAALLTLHSWSTGDVKLTIKAVADTGWLMMDDTSIGNDSSGATHTGSAFQALYNLMWANIPDSYAPVTGGRGATAAADWAAQKKLGLLQVLGRALASQGTGSGLSGRTVGQPVGAETVTLGTANLPAYTPSGTLSLSSVVSGGTQGGTTNTVVTPSGAIQAAAGTIQNVVVTTTGTFTGAAQGGTSTPASIMQPTTFLYVMIKL